MKSPRKGTLTRALTRTCPRSRDVTTRFREWARVHVCDRAVHGVSTRESNLSPETGHACYAGLTAQLSGIPACSQDGMLTCMSCF